MAFQITMEQFEGPLDVMLHLIKENKLDLFDLDMNVLTTQYLAYLDAMESLHLEIASEYLSELAGLIEYKSKTLLPRAKVEISEEYEGLIEQTVCGSTDAHGNAAFRRDEQMDRSEQ